MIRRFIYQDLVRWKKEESSKILFVEGSKFIGKTTLVRHFGKLEFSKMIYIDFVDSKYDYVNDRPFVKIRKNAAGRKIVITEEEIKMNKIRQIFDENYQNPMELLSKLFYFELGHEEDSSSPESSLMSSEDIKDTLFVFDNVECCLSCCNSLKFFAEILETLPEDRRPYISIISSELRMYMNNTVGPRLNHKYKKCLIPFEKFYTVRVEPVSFLEMLYNSLDEVDVELYNYFFNVSKEDLFLSGIERDNKKLTTLENEVEVGGNEVSSTYEEDDEDEDEDLENIDNIDDEDEEESESDSDSSSSSYIPSISKLSQPRYKGTDSKYSKNIYKIEADNPLADILKERIKPVKQNYLLALFNRFKMYLYVGGFPEVINSFINERKSTYICDMYLSDYVRYYFNRIESDPGHDRVVQNRKIFFYTNLDCLVKKNKRFFFNIFRYHARETFYERSIDYFYSNYTISSVTAVFKPSYPLNILSKKKARKFYLFDSGFYRTCLKYYKKEYDVDSYNTITLDHNEIFTEIYVYQSLIRQFGRENIFYWTHWDKRVDFLVRYRGQVIPVDVKILPRVNYENKRISTRTIFRMCYFNPDCDIRIKINITNYNFSFDKDIINFPCCLVDRLKDYVDYAIDIMEKENVFGDK